jgi:hypothetical protein
VRRLVAALAVLLAACSGADTPEATGPAYELVTTGTDTMVATTAEASEARAIFEDVRGEHRDDADAWRLKIECPDGTELASGRWANTPQGAFQTGLDGTSDTVLDIKATTC